MRRLHLAKLSSHQWTLKRRLKLLLDHHKGRDKNATNLFEYTLKFINHDITYTELLDALSTKQKEMVCKISKPSFFNCCSNTMYTGIAQSFIVFVVRKLLRKWWKKKSLEKIFRGRGLSAKFTGFAGNYFRGLIYWILLRFISKRTYFRGRPSLNKFSRKDFGFT